MYFDAISDLAGREMITTKTNQTKKRTNYVFFQIYQERFWWFRG